MGSRYGLKSGDGFNPSMSMYHHRTASIAENVLHKHRLTGKHCVLNRAMPLARDEDAISPRPRLCGRRLHIFPGCLHEWMYIEIIYRLHSGVSEKTLCQWLAALTGSVSVVLSLAWGCAVPLYEAVPKTGNKDTILRLRPNVILVQSIEVQVFSGGHPHGAGQRWAPTCFIELKRGTRCLG